MGTPRQEHEKGDHGFSRLIEGYQGQRSQWQSNDRIAGNQHPDGNGGTPPATEAQEHGPDVADERADTGKHFGGDVVINHAHHYHRRPALDDVQGAAGQPGLGANLTVYVGGPAVVVADATNVPAQGETGEEVGGGDCPDQVGQQSQPDPASRCRSEFPRGLVAVTSMPWTGGSGLLWH